MSKLIVYLLLILPSIGYGQICNFCSTEDIKNILIENNFEFRQENNFNGVIKIYSQDNKAKKTWYFKYNTCFMYQVSISEKHTKRILQRFLNKNFLKKNKYFWENIDNSVKLHTFGNRYNFEFYPKMSILNLKHINY